MKDKNCYIFDIDGTLLDSKREIINCLNFVLNEFGKQSIPFENENSYIGPSVKESFIQFHNFSESEANEAASMYRKYYVERYLGKSNLYPKVYETLEKLKINNILCIASMKTEVQVEKFLNLFNLKNFFTIVKNASYDGTYTKSQMCKDIKSELKFNCNSFSLIGDTQGDFIAAQNSHINFIFASYGYGGRTSTSSSIRTINNISEIQYIKRYRA